MREIKENQRQDRDQGGKPHQRHIGQLAPKTGAVKETYGEQPERDQGQEHPAADIKILGQAQAEPPQQVPAPPAPPPAQPEGTQRDRIGQTIPDIVQPQPAEMVVIVQEGQKQGGIQPDAAAEKRTPQPVNGGHRECAGQRGGQPERQDCPAKNADKLRLDVEEERRVGKPAYGEDIVRLSL